METQGLIPVVPFEGKYVYVGGVWVIPNATNGLTLFSDELRPNGPSSPSTIGAFKVAAGTFTTSLGHTPTTELGAPK